MVLNILIIFFTFLDAAYAAFGDTTNDQGKLTKKGYAVIIIALVLLVVGILKEVKDAKETKEKDAKITELLMTTDSLQMTIDSLQTLLSKIDTNILHEKRMLFSTRISLDPYKSCNIPFSLAQGMSIKILKQNCDNALVFNFNGKNRRIGNEDEEFSIQEISETEVFFENQSDAPCGIDYEIWGSLMSQIKTPINEDGDKISEYKDIANERTKTIEDNNSKTKLNDANNRNPILECETQLTIPKIGWGLQFASDIDCRIVLEKKEILEPMLGNRLFMFKSKKDNRYHLTFGEFVNKIDVSKNKPDIVQKLIGVYPEGNKSFVISYSEHLTQ